MDKVFDVAFLLLVCSIALRSIARTYAYICLANREKQEALKMKLLKK